MIGERNSSYVFSQYFASLKRIKEKIEVNYTTAQYLRTLDEYLLNSLYPLAVNTRLLDFFLTQVAGFQSRFLKRKVCSTERRILYSKVTRFLFAKSPEARKELLAEIRLDRGLWFGYLTTLLSDYSRYLAAHDGELSEAEALAEISKTEASVYSKVPLNQVLYESQHWLKIASEFKSKILEKYLRLTISTAQRDYTSFFQCRGSLDDLIQTYIAYLSRAVDRCDFTQGAMTSHIQTYLVAARQHCSKQEKISLKSTELISTFSAEKPPKDYLENVYLETRTAVEAESEIQELLILVDPTGVGRAYLNLDL